jgi:hypothetical protein
MSYKTIFKIIVSFFATSFTSGLIFMILGWVFFFVYVNVASCTSSMVLNAAESLNNVLCQMNLLSFYYIPVYLLIFLIIYIKIYLKIYRSLK